MSLGSQTTSWMFAFVMMFSAFEGRAVEVRADLPPLPQAVSITNQRSAELDSPPNCGSCTTTNDAELGFPFHNFGGGGTEELLSVTMDEGRLSNCNSYDGKGCHTGPWFGDCDSGHASPCWIVGEVASNVDANTVLSELVEAVDSAYEDGLRTAAERLGAHLVVNLDRGSVQVTDCLGKIVADIPASRAVLGKTELVLASFGE